MGYNKSRSRFIAYFLLLTIMIFIVPLFGCSTGEEGEPEQGEVSLNLVWGGADTGDGRYAIDTQDCFDGGPPSGNVCDDYLIENICVEIKPKAIGTYYNNCDLDGWDCDSNQGKTDALDTGYYTMEVKAKSLKDDGSGYILWTNTNYKDINVKSGDNELTVYMSPNQSEIIPVPKVEALINPADITNVPLNTTVEIEFSKKVIAASVNKNTFRLLNLDTNQYVSIEDDQIVYDYDSKIVKFNPYNLTLLSYDSNYQIVLSHCIMDYVRGGLVEPDPILAFSTEESTSRVTNILTGTKSSDPNFFVTVNKNLFFLADDGTANGYGVWKCVPGEQEDTVVLFKPLTRDLNVQAMMNYGSDLFIFIDDGTNDYIRVINSENAADSIDIGGFDFTLNDDSRNYLVMEDGIYFVAAGDTSRLNYELWVCDGTNATQAFGLDDSDASGSYPRYMVDSSSELFLVADCRMDCSFIWRSIGDANGNHRVIPDDSAEIRELTNIGDTLYFVKDDGSVSELYTATSDPMSGVYTPHLVENPEPARAVSNPYSLIPVNETLFFGADVENEGVKLCYYDPNRDPDFGILDAYSPAQFVNLADQMLFFVADVDANTNLCALSMFLDLTSYNIKKQKEIHLGYISEMAAFQSDIAPYPYLLFVFEDAINGSQLWRWSFKDIDPSPYQCEQININKTEGFNEQDTIKHLTYVNDRSFFAVNNGIDGMELWAMKTLLDSNASIVKDINTSSISPKLSELVYLNNDLFFLAKEEETALRLMMHDSNDNKTISIDTGLSYLRDDPNERDMISIGNKLYFVIRDINSHETICSIEDGDPATKWLYTNPDLTITDINGLIRVGDTLFFKAKAISPDEGNELFKIDNSEGMIIPVFIKPGTEGSNPNNLTTANDVLFGTVDTSTDTRREIFRIASDANQVKLFNIKTNYYEYQQFFIYANYDDSGYLIFNAYSFIYKAQIDPNGALVDPINKFKPICKTNNLRGMKNVNNRLFFRATPQDTNVNIGDELCMVDIGCDPNTVYFFDINPGPLGSSTPMNFTVMEDMLFFTATRDRDPNYNIGNELWMINCTNLIDAVSSNPADQLINTYDRDIIDFIDIRSGSQSSSPSGLIAIQGVLFFTADNGSNGRELWKCGDGDMRNICRIVKDINLGIKSSTPRSLREGDEGLYFIADDGEGDQVWKTMLQNGN